jgi:hypothetical protein
MGGAGSALADRYRLAHTFRRRAAAPHHGLSGSYAMSIRELDSVVLEHDLPEDGLRRGDLGPVVHLYDARTRDVEFVRLSGQTQAVVQLAATEVRPVQGMPICAPFGPPTFDVVPHNRHCSCQAVEGFAFANANALIGPACN